MSRAYFIRRLFYTLILLIVVVSLNFFLPRIVPGDPAQRFYKDPRLSESSKLEIKKQFGLDKSLGEQYFVYLSKLVKGDLGVSFQYNRPVINVIGSKLPWTLFLTLTSTFIALLIGIIFGLYAGWKRGGRIETSLLFLSIITSAVPAFWVALLLIMFFSFSWNILPSQFTTIDPSSIISIFKHSILPIFTLATFEAVGYAVLVRNSMVDIIGEDYIRTAKAKGLSSQTVLFKHVFRNASLPLVTSIGLSLAGLVGGTIIIERVFSWDGMGLLLLEASSSYDYPLMQGIMLILATITILANFLTDIVYSKLDPRVQLK